MSTEPSWDVYRSFAAVLREGSLSAAARTLGLAQPSIARHIDALEQSIGGALFVRSPRGLSPTDRALALRPHADALVAAAEALRRTGSGAPDGAAGVVRISASDAVGTLHLPPLLARLRRAHPDLAIELALTDDVDDLLQRHADIAVRMVRPSQQALVARGVGAVHLGLYAHRAYLERRGTPATFADLPGHDLIGPDRETPFTRDAMRHMPGIDPAMFALRVDSNIAQMAAVREGFGIGVCQTAVVDDDPDLRRVLADVFDLPLPVWIVMHEDLRSIARCRITFDALADGLAAVTSSSR